MARRTAANAIDWEALERQYRLGTQSNTQLSVAFGVSVSSIGRRASAKGWVADKREEVEATTHSLLIQNASGNANPNATPTPLEIKAAAQVATDIVLGHRQDAARSRVLFQKLLAEVEAETDALDLFLSLGELLDTSGPDKTGNWRQDKLNELYKKVISQAGRIDNAKKLVEILEKVVKLERQAFGILDGSEEKKSGAEEMFAAIGAKLRTMREQRRASQGAAE